jgi:NADH pyrophosphatase NudC (nudix superfamily)
MSVKWFGGSWSLGTANVVGDDNAKTIKTLLTPKQRYVRGVIVTASGETIRFCEYCHKATTDDKTGLCSSCGAPRKEIYDR